MGRLQVHSPRGAGQPGTLTSPPTPDSTAPTSSSMHLSRLVETPTWQALATIAVWRGGLGILLGCLWSRHRSVWGVPAVHTAVNSLILLPVVLG